MWALCVQRGAPVIYFVFFYSTLRFIFFLMQGPFPVLDVLGSGSGSLQGLSSFWGSFCEGCCVWSAGLRTGS